MFIGNLNFWIRLRLLVILSQNSYLRMNPSERIKHIKAIAEELGKEDWALIDFTLRQFNLPWSDAWNGDGAVNYVIDMTGDADSGVLIELGKHLGTVSELESSESPTFWQENEPRIFISHLVAIKGKTVS